MLSHLSWPLPVGSCTLRPVQSLERMCKNCLRLWPLKSWTRLQQHNHSCVYVRHSPAFLLTHFCVRFVQGLHTHRHTHTNTHRLTDIHMHHIQKQNPGESKSVPVEGDSLPAVDSFTVEPETSSSRTQSRHHWLCRNRC